MSIILSQEIVQMRMKTIRKIINMKKLTNLTKLKI